MATRADDLDRAGRLLCFGAVHQGRPRLLDESGDAVSIGARRQNDRWIFAVTDNGIGIDAEYREQIFGMFQRLHGRDAYPGTGIGLAICLRIVQAHDGHIWVEPSDEAGTCFCFTLSATGYEAT